MESWAGIFGRTSVQALLTLESPLRSLYLFLGLFPVHLFFIFKPKKQCNPMAWRAHTGKISPEKLDILSSAKATLPSKPLHQSSLHHRHWPSTSLPSWCHLFSFYLGSKYFMHEEWETQWWLLTQIWAQSSPEDIQLWILPSLLPSFLSVPFPLDWLDIIAWGAHNPSSIDLSQQPGLLTRYLGIQILSQLNLCYVTHVRPWFS